MVRIGDNVLYPKGALTSAEQMADALDVVQDLVSGVVSALEESPAQGVGGAS